MVSATGDLERRPAGAFDYANRGAERYAVARSNTTDDANADTRGYAVAPPRAPPRATFLNRYAILLHSDGLFEPCVPTLETLTFSCDILNLYLHQHVSNSHEGEAEQVGAFPFRGVGGVGVRGFEADAPNIVVGAGFDKDFAGGGYKEVAHLGVLGEFVVVAIDHDVEFMAIPKARVEIADFAAKFFYFTRVVGVHNQGPSFPVAHQTGFFSHHELLGRGIDVSVDDKNTFIPLAKAGFGRLPRGGPVAPKMQECMLAAA